MDFQLKTEYIELDNLLKVLNLVESGAHARQCIELGVVKLNGEVERRIRKKLRAGDVVEFSEQKISISAPAAKA